MDDEKYLQEAIELAKKTNERVGCGSVLVDKSGKVIASSYNTQHTDNLTASHAEMKAIAAANKIVGRKLTGITAYGSCEPCTMCLTALIFAGVERIVFANRLNDLVTPDRRIDIDCFEFVTKFPYQPKIEYIKI